MEQHRKLLTKEKRKLRQQNMQIHTCKIYVQIENTKKSFIKVVRRQKKNTSASENTE